ncbi:transmembrane protein 160 [Lethenteron reissneri]|uniref:transmembrane protein 160 n=1 Tax=Lethenteron reissneri TaxID=7753 RepID=UPI002AB6F1A2|nr:transmembrane protein 160 [Lethenteron reissneri]
MSTRLAMPRLPAALRRVIGGPGPPRPAGETCPGWWPVLGRVSRQERGAGMGVETGAQSTSWLPVLAGIYRQGFTLGTRPSSATEACRGWLLSVLGRVSRQDREPGVCGHLASVRGPCRVRWPDLGRVTRQARGARGLYVGFTTGPVRVPLPEVGPRRESRGLHTGTHYGARRNLQGQGDGPGLQGANPGQRTEARGSSELDRADAFMMRKAQETGYLSWLRNGLLATGIGIIAFVQSDMGREAAYGFFILGGLCISYGTASHMANIAVLRRAMMLSTSAVVLNTVGVLTLTVLWLTAVTLYVGRLEVEIVRDNGGEWDEGCEHCRGHEGEEEGKGRADK